MRDVFLLCYLCIEKTLRGAFQRLVTCNDSCRTPILFGMAAARLASLLERIHAVRFTLGLTPFLLLVGAHRAFCFPLGLSIL